MQWDVVFVFISPFYNRFSTAETGKIINSLQALPRTCNRLMNVFFRVNIVENKLKGVYIGKITS